MNKINNNNHTQQHKYQHTNENTFISAGDETKGGLAKEIIILKIFSAHFSQKLKTHKLTVCVCVCV